jgi:hypothetical protein
MKRKVSITEASASAPEHCSGAAILRLCRQYTVADPACTVLDYPISISSGSINTAIPKTKLTRFKETTSENVPKFLAELTLARGQRNIIMSVGWKKHVQNFEIGYYFSQSIQCRRRETLQKIMSLLKWCPPWRAIDQNVTLRKHC